uniref:Uncharacterized protein n=1 Tax=Physcomitrium patens TaxID=3218 RepID=A0A2K1IGK9_PHYPA|nr:hypothetical protein PHYPA_029006 [Physcomitrium patens]
MEDFTPELLQLNPDEKVVANFMPQLHQMLEEEGTTSILRLLKSVACLAPTLAPSQNTTLPSTGPNSDPAMPRDCPDRLNVEKNYFAKQIENIVAFEDADRTERHESLEQWSKIMQTAGFSTVPLSHYAYSQAVQLLWQFCDRFWLRRLAGCISLTWQNRSLITVSAWNYSKVRWFWNLVFVDIF